MKIELLSIILLFMLFSTTKAVSKLSKDINKLNIKCENNKKSSKKSNSSTNSSSEYLE